MIEKENITVPRWFLEVVEDTLRIQNNINLEKGTGETCQDRNVKQSLNGIRKLLKGEELTGMERLEKLQPQLPSNLYEAAENRVTENGRFEITSFEKMRIDDIMFGAEWMAGQGETQEHFVIGHTEESHGHPVIIHYPESFEIGDEVIVQIRKKWVNYMVSAKAKPCTSIGHGNAV